MADNLSETRKFAEDIYTCNRTRCGYCREHCPSYSLLGFESYSGRGRMLIARGLLENKIEASPELRDSIFKCTTCGYCKARCALENVKMLEALRHDVGSKVGFLKKHELIANNIGKEGNPYGEQSSGRTAWLSSPGLLPATGNKESNILYFVGCTAAYREKGIASSSFNVLKKLGVKFIISGEENCCGSPLLRTGQFEEAAKAMKKNVELFKKNNVRKIITNCAGCMKTLKNDYPEILGGFDIEVVHITEFLDKLDFKPARKLQMKVAYHDPCHLGRGCEIYEEPRALLRKTGAEVLEFERNRKYSYCCGAGGGLKSAFPELALEIAKTRINQAPCGTIVTSCPFCKKNLEDAGAKVLDVTQLLEMSLV